MEFRTSEASRARSLAAFNEGLAARRILICGESLCVSTAEPETRLQPVLQSLPIVHPKKALKPVAYRPSLLNRRPVVEIVEKKPLVEKQQEPQLPSQATAKGSPSSSSNCLVPIIVPSFKASFGVRRNVPPASVVVKVEKEEAKKTSKRPAPSQASSKQPVKVCPFPSEASFQKPRKSTKTIIA